jgi:hypothetical protein
MEVRIMLEETIARIEVRLKSSDSLSEENRSELLALLAQLRNELEVLSRTDPDHARSVAAFAELTAHEATREKKKPSMFHLSAAGLTSSVQDLELSHPKLTALVNSICQLLSNTGI